MFSPTLVLVIFPSISQEIRAFLSILCPLFRQRVSRSDNSLGKTEKRKKNYHLTRKLRPLLVLPTMLSLFGSSDATETDTSAKDTSSQSVKGGLKTRSIEVWENQRYQVGVGFNAEGLLPTDRLNFSDKDGTKHFTTLEEATTGLLTPGWRWIADSQWLVNSLRGNPRDGPGWSYAIDFVNDEENYAKEMNALHYVRR